MAAYHTSQRHVNLSHFLSTGNAIPSSPQDALAPRSDDFNIDNIDDDLAQFTNAEFLDFDTGDILNADPTSLDLNLKTENGAKDGDTAAHEKKDVDFINTDFSFPPLPFDLPPSPPISQPQYPLYTSAPSSIPQHQQQPYPPQPYPVPYAHAPLPPHDSTPITTQQQPVSSPTESSSSARHVAEEDKRRRNTAASARFRVKKKQREQALEKTAEELKARAAELEAKVRGLETENEWLRGLVVGKGGVDRERGKKRKVREEESSEESSSGSQ